MSTLAAKVKAKEKIKNFYDVELVRRELYDYKFLGRKKDGSEYWKEG